MCLVVVSARDQGQRAPNFGLAFNSAIALVMSLTVEFELTSQYETSSERAQRRKECTGETG
jgi:hypothetical protein